jgi:site-specific DNA-methyltransferase (adenine-specific)
MITLLNTDCLLADVADNSIDLLLTDPPYNISSDGAKPEWLDPVTGENKNTIHSQRFSESFEQDWDDVSHEEFLAQMTSWSEYWFAKLRRGGSFAVFISDQYISHLWKIMEATGFEPKRVWTWKKPAAVPFNRRVNPVSGCEYVLWGIKPGGPRCFNSDATQGSIVERYASADKISSIVYKIVKDSTAPYDLAAIFGAAQAEAERMLADRKRDGDIIQCVVPNTITYSGGLGRNKIHPTQKPTEILEYFIELLSKPGDTVLDTFAGSGSTGMAAEKLGRNCILIERDVKMFAAMSKQFDLDSPRKTLFSTEV